MGPEVAGNVCKCIERQKYEEANGWLPVSKVLEKVLSYKNRNLLFDWILIFIY